MNKRKYDPIEGEVLPVFFHYAIPSVIGLLAASSAIMIDGIFVGNHVGAEALASVNLAMPAWNALFAFILMVSIGGSVITGKYIGEGNYDRAANTFTKVIITAIAFSLTIATFGLLFLDTVTKALGAPPELIGLVSDYLTIIFAFSPLFLVGIVLFYFVRVDNSPVLASSALFAGAAINVFLDWLFIVEFQLGIKGAAYATGIAESCVLLILIPHLFSNTSKLKFTSIAGKWSDIGKAMFNGFSDFSNEISIGLTTLLFNWVMITKLGVEGVAAFTIVNYIFFLGLMIFWGISESLQPLISKNLGAGNDEKILIFFKTAMTATSLVAVIICLLLALTPSYLIDLFLESDEADTIALATEFVSYFWPAFLFSGLNINLTEYFTASHKPIQSATIAISRSLIFPCLLLLTLPSMLGDKGIFIAIPIAEAITFIIGMMFYYFYQPKHLISDLSI